MFELVRAISLDPAAGTARGRVHIPDAPWLADHFPDSPTVPATLLLELAAQIAGVLAEDSRAGATYLRAGATYLQGAVLGLVRSAVFRTAVRFPAEVEIGVRVVRREGASVVCRAEIEGVMTVELGFALVAVDPESAAWQAREERVQRWQAAW